MSNRKQYKLKKSITLFNYINIYFGYWINKNHFDKIINVLWFEFRIGRFAIDIEFNTARKYYFHVYPIFK